MSIPPDPELAANDPPPAGEGAVIGQALTLDAVQPSAAQVNATRKQAKARTGQQLLAGSIVVHILCWLLRLNGVDLNPLPEQVDIPPEVASDLGSLITFGVAWLMNRPVSEDDE